MRWLAATVALAMPLAGCGALSKSDGGAAVQPHGKLQRVVYVNPLPGSRLWDRIGECAQEEGERLGIDVSVVGPPGGNVDVQAMQNMLSQAIANKAQGIMTWSALAQKPFDQLFLRHRRAGGVVATLLSRGKTEHQNFDVSTDLAVRARRVIEAVAREPGRQRLAVIDQNPDAGMADYEAAIDQHPDVTLVDVAYDNGQFSRDEQLATAMLTKDAGINALFVYNGNPGALAAIRQRDLDGEVVAFADSGDAPDAVVPYVEDAIVRGVGMIDSCGTGRLTINRLRDAYAGRDVAREHSDGYRMYSAAEFLRRLRAGEL